MFYLFWIYFCILEAGQVDQLKLLRVFVLDSLQVIDLSSSFKIQI